MEKIAIGRIINTHGLKGEAKIESWSDFDAMRYQKGNKVYLEKDGSQKEVTVRSFRMHKGYALVSFEELPDLNSIESYRGYLVTIGKEMRHTLEKGKYYVDQIIGLNVFDEDGNPIGKVIRIERLINGQNNLRVERADGTTVLIPNIPAFVRKVDLAGNRITIHVIEGLL